MNFQCQRSNTVTNFFDNFFFFSSNPKLGFLSLGRVSPHVTRPRDRPGAEGAGRGQGPHDVQCGAQAWPRHGLDMDPARPRQGRVGSGPGAASHGRALPRHCPGPRCTAPLAPTAPAMAPAPHTKASEEPQSGRGMGPTDSVPSVSWRRREGAGGRGAP